MAEVFLTSEAEQQALFAALGDIGDEDNSGKVHTNEGEDDSFELYGEWPQLEELLTHHLSFRSEEVLSSDEQPPPEKESADVSILVPVCRNSKLSEDLYDAGFENVTNLVVSDSVMSVMGEMMERNESVRPKMKWRIMEITEKQFANGTFDAIVDNGGLDSLMKPTPGSSLGFLYLSEVKRVLKAGGKYVCLTLAERLILDLLFPMFRFGWKMSLYAIGQKASSRDPKLQTFIVVAEKMSSPTVYAISSFVGQHFFESNSNQARDLCDVFLRENMTRLKYPDGADTLYSFEDVQFGAIGNPSKLVPGRRVRLSIGTPAGFTYNGVLLDAKEDSGPFTYPYAVFLVPQNRAHEWLYTSEEGQWLAALDSKASRLLMILLDSSKSDLSLEFIQKDLSLFAKHLEPEDCGEGFQIQYLFADDGMSKRETVYQDVTGPIVVEDVIYQDMIDDDYEGCTFRRLIFTRTDSLVQSQALLSIKESNRISIDVGKDKEQDASKSRRKGKQRKSDSQSSTGPVSSGEVKVVHDHLVSPYHCGIVFGIRLMSSFLKESTSARGLVQTVVIGLGGGLLPMFLKNCLPSLKIEVVELDRKILHVARDYFGFHDESLKVHITDGLNFVREKADGNSSSKIDILVIDVPTPDSSSALTSPAADFVDESFLLKAKDSLSEQGLFIINMVSASSDMRNAVSSTLRKVFSNILILPIKKDMDEVLFALNTTYSSIKEDQFSEVCNELAKSLEQEKKQIEKELGLSNLMKLL